MGKTTISTDSTPAAKVTLYLTAVGVAGLALGAAVEAEAVTAAPAAD
jgi:hypothetical protein